MEDGGEHDETEKWCGHANGYEFGDVEAFERFIVDAFSDGEYDDCEEDE